MQDYDHYRRYDFYGCYRYLYCYHSLTLTISVTITITITITITAGSLLQEVMVRLAISFGATAPAKGVGGSLRRQTQSLCTILDAKRRVLYAQQKAEP